MTFRFRRWIWTTLLGLVIFPFVLQAGRVKRCFVCRSRGDMGDCRDPFVHNATTVESVRAIEGVPCAAGWCAKIIEGKGDDYAIATERMCLQRPPGDEEQRCAPTLYQNRKVLMCFCKGDLCNGSPSQLAYASGTIISVALVLSIWRL